MIEYHKLWTEQVEASLQIREEFGIQKALGYLIGEKYLRHLRESETDEKLRSELPAFATSIRNNFDVSELKHYFEGATRVGSLGHTLSDEQFDEMAESGLFENGESLEHQAQDILRMGQAKELLTL